MAPKLTELLRLGTYFLLLALLLYLSSKVVGLNVGKRFVYIFFNIFLI